MTALSLLFGTALAAAPVTVIPWSQLGAPISAPESKTLGPDLLAAGPRGELGVWSAATAELWLLSPLDAARAQPRALDVGVIDGVAWTTDGLVLLDTGARRLRLLDPSGAALDEIPLPALVPTGITLLVQDHVAYGVDVFGNRRPIARVTSTGFRDWDGDHLLPPTAPVRWDAAHHTLSAAQVSYRLPDAVKASGQALQGGDTGWLVVSQVTGDGPLRVERQVAVLGEATLRPLPTGARLYAPTQDLAVDGRGHLIWMSPQADGLHLGEVAP